MIPGQLSREWGHLLFVLFLSRKEEENEDDQQNDDRYYGQYEESEG